MRSGRNRVVRRLVAIVAAVLLASLAWAGPALAETPTPVAPIGALQDAASKSSPSSTAEEVSPATTEATTATKRSAAVAPNALAAPAIGGLGGIPGFPSTFPFPTSTAIPGLPPIAPGTDPATACSQVVSALRGLDPTQLSAALDSPAAIFCSALGFPLPSLPGLPGLPSSGGSFTETSFPEPRFFDDGSGHRYYGFCGCTPWATAAPVYATQVASVPKGGVNTGDGSFGP